MCFSRSFYIRFLKSSKGGGYTVYIWFELIRIWEVCERCWHNSLSIRIIPTNCFAERMTRVMCTRMIVGYWTLLSRMSTITRKNDILYNAEHCEIIILQFDCVVLFGLEIRCFHKLRNYSVQLNRRSFFLS